MGAEEPLPPQQAYPMSARAIGPDRIEVMFEIAPRYYLYKEKFKFFIQPEGSTVGTPDLPKGEMKQDPQFGWVETYHGTLRFILPIQAANFREVNLVVSSQGCWEGGVCYPPLEQSASVNLVSSSPGGMSSSPSALAAAIGDGTGKGRGTLSDLPVAVTPLSSSTPAANPPTDISKSAGSVSVPSGDGQHFANLLKDRSLPAALWVFFGLGVLLAFTPCVLPMLPILSSLIVSRGHALTKRSAFGLSLVYVFSMALTYAIAGVIAGASGTLLSTQLQNPWVLGGFALLFVLLSLSMFGFYEFQMPTALQTRLSNQANQHGGGQGVWGIAVMGVLSALIVGPCVTAPLVGGLLYISQTGNAVFGGFALFALGLGMGAPLIMVVTAARGLLPKPGGWMESVKKGFGVILLATAIWVVTPVLPAGLPLLGWAALALVCAVFLHALDPLPVGTKSGGRFWKGVGIILLIYGAALLIGALSGRTDPLRPLAGFSMQGTNTASKMAFDRVKNLADLEGRLAHATQPVILDFYADWCVSCKEMETFTFAEPAVAEKLGQFVRLQADVTQNTEEDKALLKRFGLYGPPGIIFFNPQGQEQQTRVVGYQKAEDFIQVLHRAQACGEDRSVKVC